MPSKGRGEESKGQEGWKEKQTPKSDRPGLRSGKPVGKDDGDVADTNVPTLESSRWGDGSRRPKGGSGPAPNFGLSGKLAEEANTEKGVVLKYSEPPEASKPDLRWRLYVFKNGEVCGEPIPVHRQSCYLFGRDRNVVDIPTDHPSCSKQHAVLQFRIVEEMDVSGMTRRAVKPYVLDLGSVNGTTIGNDRLDPERFYELMERDVLRFGMSSREYVVLHENSVQ
ncbi:unnamed protein product [Ostreobium quekettii]|uniref:FHA domain-containing protein n=1 Tax=Ostreobium quekettii TaxID=121088 RepID=A0A8S1IKJ1_9CHLO|nr:unnamed protein product [Ostreobium quekettii]